MKYYQSKPKLLFLYTELAGYFIACLKKTSELYNIEIHVIHWPVNKEAPFKFSYPKDIHFYDRSQYDFNSLKKLVHSISPDAIFCSGWMDKQYLEIARGFKKKIPITIGLDTQWRNTLKQYLACVLSRITLKRIFTHCWVPGSRQKKYALNLGFKNERIVTGAYCADVESFQQLGDKFLIGKTQKYPHIFIFAGRYIRQKGIRDLWDAFIAWQNEQANDWDLWCIGTGIEKPIEHTKIKHFGFIQPEDISYFVENGGVFVLPSLFEPWGVVLHEYAAAGLPLICSDAVGASEAFIEENKNGFIFKAGNKDELKSCFEKIAILSNDRLLEMGNISRQLAMNITFDTWAAGIMSIVNSNNKFREL